MEYATNQRFRALRDTRGRVSASEKQEHTDGTLMVH